MGPGGRGGGLLGLGLLGGMADNDKEQVTPSF